MIPKIIHQVWLNENEVMPEAWQASPRRWKAHHPSWEYRLWSRANVEELISSRFPEYLTLWHSLPYLVAKADVARYLILLTHGGVYSDHDVLCNRPLDDLLCHQVVLPLTEPFGVSNDFMMTQPNSRLFQDIVKNLPSNLTLWNRVFVPPYLRVMCGVGSFYVSTCNWRIREENTRLLSHEEYGSQTDAAYVHHITGNSWGEWDAILIRKLYRHRKWFSIAGLLVLVWLIARSLNL